MADRIINSKKGCADGELLGNRLQEHNENAAMWSLNLFLMKEVKPVTAQFKVQDNETGVAELTDVLPASNLQT